MAYDKNGNPYIKRAFNTQVLLINFHYFFTQYCTLRFVNNSMHAWWISINPQTHDSRKL
jgi:hypothetical protein